MATLNENRDIEDWAKDTFKGEPRKTLLPRGKVLFKLSKFHPINTSKGGTVTQFWSDYESTSKGDWGWEGLQWYILIRSARCLVFFPGLRAEHESS